MTDKTAIREIIRTRKRAMSEQEIVARSRLLASKLFATEAYRQAAAIYSYISYNQEVRTIPILERALLDKKQIAVPKIYGRDMRFIAINGFDLLSPGFAGIPEPIVDEPVADIMDALVIVPGLAFDLAGHRIGYGGGFYDRFLSSEPHHPTIALCYDFQVFPSLENDAFDVPVDYVLWE